MNSNLQKVIEILAQKGFTDEQIADFCVDITKAAYMHMHVKMVELLPSEELDRIETLLDEQADSEMKRLYKEKTGQDVQEELDAFIKKFSNAFIEAQQEQIGGAHDINFEDFKKEIELALADAILKQTQEEKITFEQSQDISRYILSKIDDAKSVQDLVMLLQDVASKWDGFKETYELYTLKVGDKVETQQKLEQVKEQLLQEITQ
jgi:hypothetical protein